ncbi:MAG: Lipid biosynthesis (Kdo)2-(Lauroyl)-lipid acyltransferase superfamily protein [Pseudomonadota bacterium]|jgi:KDO2-lipid IV(A) lauroyltransferase
MWILKLLAHLPLSILYLFADLVYWIIYYFKPYRKAVVLENLRRSFPNKTTAEIQIIAQQFYRNFADVTFEIIKTYTISKSDLIQRVKIKNPEILNNYKNQPLIFMSAHYCNWEWLLLGVAAQMPFPLAVIYKPLHYKPGDDFMLKVRARFNVEPIAVKQISRALLKRRNEMYALCLLADQSPTINESKYWTTFLNQDSAFPLGIERITQLSKATIFYANMKRLKRGYYEISFELIDYDPAEENAVLSKYVAIMEKQITETPADWLWSYRKWKYPKPD